MNEPPRLQDPPSDDALLALAALLRRDGYAELQYVPFADHDRAFVEAHLESAVHEELHTLAAVKSRQPVVYSYSLNAAHYAKHLGERQRVLARLFLHARPVEGGRVRALAADYEPFLRQHGDGTMSFGLRIVPVFELLLLADPIDAVDDRRVFLHNDSVQMARFLRDECPCRALAVADVGTGSGLLAAVAATQGARQVMAVDINPRALAFARASFVMTGVEGIELLEGSLSRAVDRAELILSNPPYMTGRSAMCLAGGGDDGLDIPREFVRSAAMHRRRLLMLLETYDGYPAPRLGRTPLRKVVLRSFAGRELAVYEFATGAAD